jgi:pyridoxal phosphate enzyme (YggS family)
MSTLTERYEAVKARIPGNVKLIAVSKTRSVAEIQALYDLGHRAFGENYPQELREKQPMLPADIEWHFIGHLQTNKVKYIAPFVHLVHGVDGPKLLHELNKRALANDRVQDVLMQVHVAQEETKFGFSPDELGEVLSASTAEKWPALRIKGLMGMASNTLDQKQVTREFEALAALFQRSAGAPGVVAGDFTELSMGMSGDAELAIAAGSTMVRIGTAIFGERP